MSDLIGRTELLKWLEVSEFEHLSGEKCFESMMREIKNAPAVNRWIPCSERLPKEKADVIAVIDGCSREAFYSDSSFIGSNFYRRAEEVTYWMPKPEPPESEVQHD